MSEQEKPAGNPQVNVRLPADLGVKLSKDAKKKRTTVQAVILEIVATHYELEFVPPKRGQPKKNADE